MRAFEFLCEKQIFDMDKLTSVAVNISTDPVVQNWFKKKLVRYMTSEYDGPALFPVPVEKTADGPEWQRKAAESGDLFHVVWSNDRGLYAKCGAIADYLANLKHNNPPQYARIDRMTFQQADAAQQAWHEAMAKKASVPVAVNVEGQQEVLDVGNMTWWMLTSKEALVDEGNAMGHCVGDYWSDVSEGDTQIYSLRDKKNMPHITVEVNVNHYDQRHDIKQVKAKGNAGCPAKYVPAVIALVEKAVPDWNWDDAIDDMTRDSGYVFYNGTFVPFEEGSTKVGEIDGLEVRKFVEEITDEETYAIADGAYRAKVCCTDFDDSPMHAFSLAMTPPKAPAAFPLLVKLVSYLAAQDIKVQGNAHRQMLHCAGIADWHHLDGQWMPWEDFDRAMSQKISAFRDPAARPQNWWDIVSDFYWDIEAHYERMKSRADPLRKIGAIFGVEMPPQNLPHLNYLIRMVKDKE